MRRNIDSNAEAIDFVVMWVNPEDELWQNEKRRYSTSTANKEQLEANKEIRYRDWDNLKYWFRGIETFAPWVRKVHFVTWRTIPDWLDPSHTQLNIVLNRDILPEGCDPVFSSNPLEINLHRIKGLAEKFVYFNDDMFLINDVKPTDFYVNGLPREMAVSYALTNDGKNDTFPHMLLTMTGIINDFYKKREVQKRYASKWLSPIYGKQLWSTVLSLYQHRFSGLLIPHLPSSMKKSTYNEVWEAIPEKLYETSTHKFRTSDDLFQYIFRYWAICKGEFYPTNVYQYGKEFFLSDDIVSEICETICKKKYKMICINDSQEVCDFENDKNKINAAFQSILPKMSSFEKR